MKTELILVENLHCEGCAAGIRQALGKLPGVKGVSVDLGSSSVTVEHTGGVERGAFVGKLDRMGYAEAGHSTALKKAKSYVSCAIGRLS